MGHCVSEGTVRIIRAVYAPIQIYELSASKLHRRGIFSLQESLLTGSFLFLHDFFATWLTFNWIKAKIVTKEGGVK